MSESLKPYLNQKRVAKSAFTRLKNKTSEELNQLDSAKLNVIRTRFCDLGEELKGIFSNIFGVCKDEEIDKYSEEREEVFESLDEMLAIIDRKTMKENVNKSEITSNASFHCNEIKLPTLSLPTFSGVVEEWLTFSDLFKAAVSENPNISGAQKLQYLKGVLKGEAQKIIQSIPITDDNFQIAWNLLSERYFHKREILSSLMKKFLNMPQLNNESHIQILNLVDSTKEYVRLLETLDLKIDKTADTILLYIVLFKLDPTTRSWWERSLKENDIPKLDQLLQFLSSHARSIVPGNQAAKKNTGKKVTVLASGLQTQCVYCKGGHSLTKCDSFVKLPVFKRVQFVKNNNICFNCLAPFHHKTNCKSSNKCHKCKKSHHTYLHYENNNLNPDLERNATNTSGLSAAAKVFQPAAPINVNTDVKSVSEVVQNSNITSCCSDFGSDAQVLLCTAVVRVNDSFGGVQMCRALLDPGSQASLITKDCLNRLGLQKKRANLLISCLGSSDTRTLGVSQIEFSPHFPSNSYFSTPVYVVEKIIGKLPHVSLDASWSEAFSDLKLADPSFYLSSQIDILLGVNIALPMLKGQLLKTDEEKPFAVRSELGWIIAGKVSALKESSSILINNIQVVSDEVVTKFWQLDSVPTVSLLTSAEKACEEFFVKTHYRDSSGRYVIKLPFHTPPTNLGNSRQSAFRRLKSLEHSLSACPEKYNQYRQFMSEYLELGHMEVVPESEYAKREAYYLPHHAVLRESSSTTKLRVVFDGSAKSSTGYSLNDLLMIGPRVQNDLYPILLRFRTFNVAVCADVEKMFRQIKVHPDDTDWQRILWRDSPEEPVKEYRLVTVTYGTACAPYLSTRVLNQLALDERNDYPLASYATLNHFYVDDLLSGAASKEEAVELVKQLKQMMQKGGFYLRKWNSNVPEIFEENCGEQKDISIEAEGDVKVLGIKWIPKKDCFSFTVLPAEEKTEYSKREILSEIAHIFDPMGLISPCVVFMKILLQELWKHKLSWDEPIPEELNKLWISFRKELHLIEQVVIPRCVLTSLYVTIELHAFCDASEKAYCAAIYVRCILSNSQICVSLFTSKTRVAPLKSQSLPRLELCAALLLADVLQIVLKNINLPIERTVAWTDSTITLAWLSSEPYRWQQFVANRVSKIQSTIPSVKWCHVPGSSNPSDLGTRGLFPSQLVNNKLWLHGPDWLSQPLNEETEFKIPDLSSLPDSALKEERKLTTCVGRLDSKNHKAATCPIKSYEIFEKYSSWSKLRRIIALCLRFIHNCRSPTVNRITGFLSTEELRVATRVIIKKIQFSHFFEEISSLKSGKEISAHSKILSLTPFLDNEGLLRVGGRLKNAKIPESQRFPILLPKNSHITSLIIMHHHVNYLHAAQELLLSILRMQYWILSARSEVRKIIHRCLPCVKNRGKIKTQLMGDLPASRVQPSRPFTVTGVDFAGPILTKCQHKRRANTFKSYICLFICLSTKAVHLELVSSLSTDAFLATLRRFIGRRGKPARIISDCASNFRKASKELREAYKFASQLQKCHQVTNFISDENIEWSFNPPAAPHFGGIWESNIKCVKFHLKRVIGSTVLTFEEFTTLLVQVEACLNSRPLCAMSSDPNDLQALTPGHFLINAPLVAIPESNLTDISMSRLKRWKLIQQLQQNLWKRWSMEYITTLQQKNKWFRSTPNLKPGDLVIIKDENVSPCSWKIGRVSDVHPGSDGRVRVVTVITSTGQLKRPITKLCLLPDEHYFD